MEDLQIMFRRFLDMNIGLEPVVEALGIFEEHVVDSLYRNMGFEISRRFS